MCPEEYLSENRRPHICCKGLNSPPRVLALSLTCRELRAMCLKLVQGQVVQAARRDLWLQSLCPRPAH